MADILEFPDNNPHVSGEAVCILCKYEWTAVAPVGTVWLECSKCGSSKGVFKYACIREDAHWTCGCDNDLFYITPDGVYCPHCGVWQKGFEE